MSAGDLRDLLDLLRGDHVWMDRGLCTPDPDTESRAPLREGVDWCPDGHQPSEREAAEMCEGCPVQAECLEYALELNVPLYVFGGTNPGRRRKIRQQRQRAVSSNQNR